MPRSNDKAQPVGPRGQHVCGFALIPLTCELFSPAYGRARNNLVNVRHLLKRDGFSFGGTGDASMVVGSSLRTVLAIFATHYVYEFTFRYVNSRLSRHLYAFEPTCGYAERLQLRDGWCHPSLNKECGVHKFPWQRGSV